MGYFYKQNKFMRKAREIAQNQMILKCWLQFCLAESQFKIYIQTFFKGESDWTLSVNFDFSTVFKILS